MRSVPISFKTNELSVFFSRETMKSDERKQSFTDTVLVVHIIKLSDWDFNYHTQMTSYAKYASHQPMQQNSSV